MSQESILVTERMGGPSFARKKFFNIDRMSMTKKTMQSIRINYKLKLVLIHTLIWNTIVTYFQNT